MRVRELKAGGFRNLEPLSFTPDEGLNLICGENAQGKTNLLEAMWLFTGGRSFRGAKDAELVAVGSGQAELFLSFDSQERTQTAELTLSASCPEAARLLLEHDAPLTLTEADDGGPVIPNELDPALYPALLAARTASIRLAQDRARPVADRLALILLLARRVQRLLDEGRDELVPVLARRFLGKRYQDRSLVRLARLRSRNGRFFPCWMVLNNMEHLTRRFGVMLDAAVGQDAPPAPFRDAFSVQYENLTVYFLFRYALKAVNDRQYLARVEQCVFHLLCLRELSADAATVQELTEVVSLYSKEVEHSEDNQALLLKLFRRGTLRWQYLALILDF